MKKLLIVSGLALLCGFKSFAAGPFTFGVQLGINSTQTKFNEAAFDAQSIVAFRGGLFARVTLKKINIQPEVHISIQRSKYSFEANVANINSTKTLIEQDLKSTNLEVPLMIGYQPIDVKLFKLRLMAGPVASFNMSESRSIKSAYEADPLVKANIESIKNNAVVQSAVWSGAVGFGVDIANITVDARYVLGLSEFEKSGGASSKLNYITATVGFKFL